MRHLIILLSISLLGCTVNSVPIEYYKDTYLDWQNFATDPTQFQMRYLVNDDYYSNASSGLERPIFFYAGNEGSVWDFYHNSGFMTTYLA